MPKASRVTFGGVDWNCRTGQWRTSSQGWTLHDWTMTDGYGQLISLSYKYRVLLSIDWYVRTYNSLESVLYLNTIRHLKCICTWFSLLWWVAFDTLSLKKNDDDDDDDDDDDARSRKRFVCLILSRSRFSVDNCLPLSLFAGSEVVALCDTPLSTCCSVLWYRPTYIQVYYVVGKTQHITRMKIVKKWVKNC